MLSSPAREVRPRARLAPPRQRAGAGPRALLLLLSLGATTSLAHGVDAESPYDDGVKQYARGEYAAAKISFQTALRRNPNDRSARSALRRLNTESAPGNTEVAAPPPATKPPARRDTPRPWERLFLVTLPRWFNFEDTIGNGLRDLGELTALNARIGQLLAERRFASTNGRMFANERRLRSLLRRTALAFPDREQV